MDCYGAYTTQSNVEQALEYQVEGYYNYVTNWWVGDYHASNNPNPGPFGHMWCYGANGQDISDDNVWNAATNGGPDSSHETFNFIWTCANGGTYWADQYGDWYSVPGITSGVQQDQQPSWTPDLSNENEYGFYSYGWQSEIGMPYAWTGHTDLNLDGYTNGGDSSGYCYIGWAGTSPGMATELQGVPYPWTGSCFALDFYWAGLGWIDGIPESVHASLDYASSLCYNLPFSETPLYQGYWVPNTMNGVNYWTWTSMRVYGDSNISPS